MLDRLAVPDEQSKAAVDVIHQNLEWERSEAVNQINNWIRERLGSTNPTQPTEVTDSPFTTTSTQPTTTLAGSQIFFSTLLGLSCAVMWLAL
jgi:hypothetical protein